MVAAFLISSSTALSCSLCAGGGLGGRQSLRQETLQAKNVYYGTLSNPRLNAANAAGLANAGATDFTVDQVIKSDSAARKAQKQFTIPRYVPVNPKEPPKYLVFCQESAGAFDPYRGTPVKSAALIDYLRAAAQIDDKDTVRILTFAGGHLDSADDDVAAEAYLELARADDSAVLAIAKKLDPRRIRRLIENSQTPPERLSLFTYLLGACGTKEDANWIRSLLRQPGDRFRGATSGLYAGLIMIAPEEGWATLLATLADNKRPFPERASALNALRFYRNANPTLYTEKVVAGLKVLLPQGDIADLPIDDLRRWKIWSLTTDVIGLYEQPGHSVPLTRRAIVRYALSCPDENALRFVAKLREQQPDLVHEVEQSLQYENSPIGADSPGKPAK